MPRHVNSPTCLKCNALFDAFPNFHSGLRSWFDFFVRAKNPDAHISQAGRGKLQQETYFLKGQSKAHWLQSAHNYNAAIDLFRLTQSNTLSYDRAWFEAVIAPQVLLNNRTNDEFKIKWYGFPGSPFFELPHCEVWTWPELVASGDLTPVEPI